MTWFKVDDSFYRSAKVRKLGNKRVPAVGLWTLCGGWSADNLADGFVPWEVITDWDPRRALARELIRVGLWFETERDGEAGCQFHDWNDWQPTRDQVIQRRKSDAERRARWRDAKRSHGVSHGVTSDEDDGESQQLSRQVSRRDTPRESRQGSRLGSALPDPTRPVSTSAGHVSRGGSGFEADAKIAPPAARGTRIPDDFAPTAEMLQWARRETPKVNLQRETENFRDYWTAKSGKDASKRDWPATWRRWMRKANDDAPGTVVNGRVLSTGDRKYLETQALKARFAARRDEPPQLPMAGAS
jgi:hypothetical protein